MFASKRRRLGLAAAVVTLVAVVAGTAIAVTTTRSAGAIERVKVKSSDSAVSTASTSYVNLPGASVDMPVPGGESAVLLIRFSGESRCTAQLWCTVRVLVDGVEAQPAAGTDFAFESNDSSGGDVYESHSMDRTAAVGAGNHTVQVQYARQGTSGTFFLDDYSLTVERAKD